MSKGIPVDLEDYVDMITSLPKIFHVASTNPRHFCYHDSENRLKIYLISGFVEVTEYLSYELRLDKGVFILVIGEINNFGIIHGGRIEVTFEIAGYDGVAATSEQSAIEFMIAKVSERILRYRNDHYDAVAVGKSLREALCPKKDVSFGGGASEVDWSLYAG